MKLIIKVNRTKHQLYGVFFRKKIYRYTYCIKNLFLKRILMKVLFPRHIKKGFFSSMTFTMGPLTVSIVQLFVLALGVAASFGVANYLIKSGNNKFIAIAAASPITLIALAIAFFEVSEMGLVEFLAKMARTHFFDTTTKFQVNIQKPDKTTILIKQNRSEEKIQKIVFKTQKDLLSEDTEEKIRDSGLL